MERQDLFEYIKSEYGIDPDYPWNDWNAVLRRPDNSKWFAAVLEVKKSKLGFDEDTIIDVVNVKCDPVMVGLLRSNAGYYPAYHMNKDKWISIALDGSVSDEEIKNLVDLSYRLVAPKQKQKRIKSEK